MSSSSSLDVWHYVKYFSSKTTNTVCQHFYENQTLSFEKKKPWIMRLNVLPHMLNCLFTIIVSRLLFHIADYRIIVDLTFTDWVHHGCVPYFLEIKTIIYKRISNALHVNDADLLFGKNTTVYWYQNTKLNTTWKLNVDSQFSRAVHI